MEMIVIILVLGALAVMLFRKPISVVYYILIVDILLKILSFFSNNIPIKEVQNFLDKFFPDNINEIINSYSTGTFNLVLSWFLIIIYIIFLYKIIPLFLSKKIKL